MIHFDFFGVFCGRRLLAECDLVSLYLHMCVADSQSLPSEVVKVRLTIVNQLSEKLSILKGDSIYSVHLFIHFWLMIDLRYYIYS